MAARKRISNGLILIYLKESIALAAALWVLILLIVSCEWLIMAAGCERKFEVELKILDFLKRMGFVLIITERSLHFCSHVLKRLIEDYRELLKIINKSRKKKKYGRR